MRVEEPIGEKVSHCNRRTEYEYIEHIYQPETCEECKICQDICIDSRLDFLREPRQNS